MLRSASLCCIVILTACSTSSSVITADTALSDGTSQDILATTDSVEAMAEDTPFELPPTIDQWTFDSWTKETEEPACDAGEGCFLDPCIENVDCLSGWCVEHMGDDVCTITCSEECPPGWRCKQVSGSGADVLFACVSDHAALCKPCASGGECADTTGGQGVCLDYGDEGAFCGGACTGDSDCPWGFSCLTTVTVDGIDTLQCVADAGVCPCTEKSVAAALFTPCEATNDFGSCAGKRVCKVDGLSACDALTPAEETCNGIDDDCDGEIDEPSLVDGDYVNLCKDENPCTEDKCQGPDGCEHVALDGIECADGNPCTIADNCQEGVCVGTAVDCDDDNPCTDDSCDEGGGCGYTPNANKCDDQDPCTVADLCEESQCVGVLVACDCQDDDDCESLEDGDLCNGTLYCDLSALPYSCAIEAGTEVTCPAPEGADKACLLALCNPITGGCSLVSANEGAPCTDKDACTIGDTCQEGTCASGATANCNDGNPCSDDSCDIALGCQHIHNAAPCSDGNVCTVGDLCEVGECVAGDVLLCDDDNPCTADGCDLDTGCSHVTTPGPCDDGNACTTGDGCSEGKCIAAGILDCDDENPCTADSCQLIAGCQHSATDGFCDDKDPCTLGDFCEDGSCVAGEALTCNDQNPCTDDACTLDGCEFKPNDGDCDDSNECTVNDGCKNGTCGFGALLNCNDDSLCTTDSCDPVQGCLHLLNTSPCDDDNLCTTGDHCQLGECLGGGALNCNDTNSCTDDSCAPAIGCQFQPNSATCSDGNACTEEGKCENGWCSPGEAIDCNDDDPCTDDSCNSESGCVHEVNTDFQTDHENCGECGEVCADVQVCQGGKCLNNHGEPCQDNVDCLSIVCRLDWDGAGTFCAKDSESCVLAFDAPSASQIEAGGLRCNGAAHKTCADGVWGQPITCAAGACNDDIFTPAQQCTDEVGCSNVVPEQCTPYKCDQEGCKESCGSAADCTGEFVCAGDACVDKIINAPGSIKAGSEYYGPALPGYNQCAGWKNTTDWDITDCDWIHSCAASGKTLRFRLHDANGDVLFDETFPSFSQSEMSNNIPGCDNSGYGTCGKAGPSGKALLVYKPLNGNSGCHGDDNSSGAVRIANSTAGDQSMGHNYVFLGGKRCDNGSFRKHKQDGTDPISEIRWKNGDLWDGCNHNDMAEDYAIAVYLSQ
jgi:hypothetical protein